MRLRARKKKGAPGLMLTSLLDMFTIILIFLIVSFEAEDYEFKLNPELSLPESTAQSVFKPAVNVAVTKAGVVIDEKTIVAMKDGRFSAAAYEAEEIPELRTYLEENFGEALAAAAEREAEAEASGEELEIPEDELGADIILLQADQDIDYSSLYLVMRTARLAGFGKYRLAVMKK